MSFTREGFYTSPELVRVVGELNSSFRKGYPAYTLLPEIRAFSKPILVDLHNVLVSNYPPTEPNPAARDFLLELRKLGTIFIVTVGEDWEDYFSVLKKNNLWFNDLILMAYRNYSFMDSIPPRYYDQVTHSQQMAKQLIGEFLKMMQGGGFQYSEDDFIMYAAADKRIAPIFAKPFKIPLIDNYWEAVDNNPGIRGILVDEFEPLQGMHDNSSSLQVGLKKVKDHYMNIK